jgi:aspartate 1-decarboxylase
VQNFMLKGKIHGAVVTDANVAYEGSITIDAALMDAAGILPHEQVQVWSVTTGERLATYAIPGVPGAGDVCINGAAAHRIKKDEVVIIAAFAWMDEKEAVKHEPRIVFVDGRNRISERRPERRRVAAG